MADYNVATGRVAARLLEDRMHSDLGSGLVTQGSVNLYQACLRSSHSESLFVPSFHLVSPIDKGGASLQLNETL